MVFLFMTIHSMRVYAGPSRYVQGRGAFSKIAQEIKGIGLQGKAFILASKTAEVQTRPLWEKSLKEAGIEFELSRFEGECTDGAIKKAAALARSAKADYMIAIGGGKTLDTARAAAEIIGLETVICPSIASTDAPCIAISVIYTESGEMQEFRAYKKNPILVLVDSDVIAKAPKRFLVSGMGDALATYYEARTCKSTYTLNPRGGLATEAGLAIAKLCRDILLADGVDVASSYETQGVTQAFERIVEANTLLSGLGVELCHVACAHAVHNGLTQLKETHGCYHGEKVAFGLITQLILEGEDFAEIHRLLQFYKQVGLPLTLKQLGVENPTQEVLYTVAKRALREGETLFHEPFIATPEMVMDAMRYADSLGKKYLD